MTDEHQVPLLLTFLPEGQGSYDRWELSVEPTGEVIASGPLDEGAEEVIKAVCRARYDERERGFGPR